MTQQLVIELGEEVARAFGGTFEEWLNQVQKILPATWSADEDPPLVSLVLSEALQDRMMSPQDRELMAKLDFDEDGIVKTDGALVEIRPVMKPQPDLHLTLDAWMTEVPDKEESQ